MRPLRAAAYICLFTILVVSHAELAHAHPMGNFSINHYSRIEIHATELSIRYIIDMAEIPTVSERTAMDTNGDGTVSEKERNAYLAAAAIRLRNGITLRMNGKQAVPAAKPVSIEFLPGAGGLLTTRITLDMIVAATQSRFQNGDSVEYADGNYYARTGWKEIVLAPDSGLILEGSNVSQTDLSRQLTAYPADATIAPLQQTEAHFTIRTHSGRGASSAEINKRNIPLVHGSTGNGAGNTPRDAFTQAIARGNLTTGLILLSLVIAFAFGALHALSPGHGKAMMAAYLVGARGTARHAVLLGLVVTVTHTIGVLVLGLVMLFAAQYVVPEKLYPALSALSGVTIAVIGAVLLRQRLKGLSLPCLEDEYNDGEDAGAYNSIPLAETAPGVSNGKSAVLMGRNRGPLSVRSLVALGITGGILPCPSALVVMLSAVALHRVAFGMILIIAFSVGLALVLTSIGICVVYMRALTERVSIRGQFVRRMPVMSAAFVTGIGLFLIFKSLHGGY